MEANELGFLNPPGDEMILNNKLYNHTLRLTIYNNN